MKRKILIIVSCVLAVIICLCGIFIPDKLEIKESVQVIQNVVNDEIKTYEMSEQDIMDLATTEIIEQSLTDEELIEEQEVEDEGFELQGEIAYEGDKALTWNATLGDYKGLTYYSQIDKRWRYNMYSSINDASQTIGSSGCGPTSAAMIVTAVKGTITPDTMSELFVRYGYRSANNGTYWSAFRAVADEFNIGYQETYSLDSAIGLLKNNNYVVASVGNGLFTTGGHFIVLVGMEGDNIKIYDPYLYAGKFDTSTRRGKVSVNGNTVYCSIDNFRNYANYKGFFCYGYDGEAKENNVKPVITSTYTRYVKVNTSLNIRNAPNGAWIGSLKNGTQVTVYETSTNWSKIGDSRWVCSDYLVSSVSSKNNPTQIYKTGSYKINASLLNVRSGAGTNYKAKTYNQLTANARQQNKKLGNYYANGYKKGVVCTVKSIKGNWGYTNSGWICLDYCDKI